MDVEFVTDHDTEHALLQWCARRRREVVPGAAYLIGAEAFILIECFFLWRRSGHISIAFVVACLLQGGAFLLAAMSRDPARPSVLPCPHAEVATLGLIALSLVVLFANRPSLLAFLLLAIALTSCVTVAVLGWHGFASIHDAVPFGGRAEHVHLDEHGLDITRRPRPEPRHIQWKSVRYLGADADMLFIVAGWIPLVVPRRAFSSRDAWEDFVDAAADHAQAALNSSGRSPIWRHVLRSKVR